MPGYVAEALQRFKHIWTSKPEDQPYAHVTHNYGTKVQYAPDDNKSRPASKEEKNLSNKLYALSCIMDVPSTVTC